MVGLVDEWAARFFEELDYVNEGENGNRFAEMMRKDLPQVSPIIFYYLGMAKTNPLSVLHQYLHQAEIIDRIKLEQYVPPIVI